MRKEVKKMPYIVPMEMPKTCIDCPCLSKPEEILVGDWMYKKICKCTIAPEEIEDPYYNLHWLINNKPEWCPLKEVKGE